MIFCLFVLFSLFPLYAYLFFSIKIPFSNFLFADGLIELRLLHNRFFLRCLIEPAGLSGKENRMHVKSFSGSSFS